MQVFPTRLIFSGRLSEKCGFQVEVKGKTTLGLGAIIALPVDQILLGSWGVGGGGRSQQVSARAEPGSQDPSHLLSPAGMTRKSQSGLAATCQLVLWAGARTVAKLISHKQDA